MKTLASAFFIVALAVVSAAQTQTASNNPPDIQISRVNWSKSYVKPDFGNNPLFAADAGSGLYTERTATVSRARVNASTPVPQTNIIGSPNPYRVQLPAWSGRTDGYLYQATLKNNGARTIKALDWEYIFTDSLSESVVARHRFQTLIKIAPGKEKKLDGFAISPPTKIVNAKTVAKNPAQPFTEQVVITRIEYTDGSVWTRPAK